MSNCDGERIEWSQDRENLLCGSLLAPATKGCFALGREGAELLGVFVKLQLQSVNPCLGFRQGKQRQFWKCKAFSVKIISLPY